MQPAKPIIVEIMQKLNPTSVLDIGCGKCKFSQKFIDLGINVIGIDRKPTTQSSENFTFIQQDILDFKFEPKYDLIVGTGILHLLKEEEAKQLIKKMQKNTIREGFHFLICMSNEENPENEIYFYPDEEVLNKLYPDWEIIYNTSVLSKEHGKPPHRHKMILFLAKKV
ncbi:MAG: methyltransferase domain-containing protein [archaeon]|nr:methyltransferase domain-containing protein [archaeon]MCR4323398.1 methyltransferase domain-containing protein [Nanoarchaeota archaeon]